MTDFDPNDVGVNNGNFFGLPHTIEQAQVVFLPVPWDVTSSQGAGTAGGPEAILAASVHLDGYDFDCPDAWQVGYGTVPISPEIEAQNREMRPIATTVIQHLEAGGKPTEQVIRNALKQVNQASTALNHWVYTQSQTLLQKGKWIGLVGGDHSVPLGYLQALAKQGSFGVLQIDAHADLRPAFEGFTYSHGSIMQNALQIEAISHLVPVGIRSMGHAEMEYIQDEPRIILFDDWQLKEQRYQGMPWANQCQQIVETLPQRVYVSFDVDGLQAAYCPHTGTPVPGGLTFNEAIYLIRTLAQSGRTIIGFDLCEVVPDPVNQWDEKVGAQLLYQLANLMVLSHSC